MEKLSFGIVLFIILSYFGVLFLISFLSSRGAYKTAFFTGDKKSPWFVVAYGMIGAALSGVTFVSIPGLFYVEAQTNGLLPVVYVSLAQQSN